MADELKEFTDIDEERVFAAMAYLFVLVIAPLARYRQEPFVNFHIRQGLLLSVGFVLAALAAVWWNTVGGLLFVLLLMADVVGIVMALQGRKWKAPFVGDLAEKIKV